MAVERARLEALAADELRFEQIKRHAILSEDFSIERGTLTPTMKIRRRVVAEDYKDLLASLYAPQEN